VPVDRSASNVNATGIPPKVAAAIKAGRSISNPTTPTVLKPNVVVGDLVYETRSADSASTGPTSIADLDRPERLNAQRGGWVNPTRCAIRTVIEPLGWIA
jgi:hypothetical protein